MTLELEEWNAIPNAVVRRYVRLMRSRMIAVIGGEVDTLGIERDAHVLKNPEEQEHCQFNINSCEFEF